MVHENKAKENIEINRDFPLPIVRKFHIGNSKLIQVDNKGNVTLLHVR